jgi:hypothetical protein
LFDSIYDDQELSFSVSKDLFYIGVLPPREGRLAFARFPPGKWSSSFLILGNGWGRVLRGGTHGPIMLVKTEFASSVYLWSVVGRMVLLGQEMWETVWPIERLDGGPSTIDVENSSCPRFINLKDIR